MSKEIFPSVIHGLESLVCAAVSVVSAVNVPYTVYNSKNYLATGGYALASLFFAALSVFSGREAMRTIVKSQQQ